MRLPLFPLHTVLCPGIALPLHVFEERYRELVRYCIDTPSPFGVVLIRDGRRWPADARVLDASGRWPRSGSAGRYPDGRFDLLVVGDRTVRDRGGHGRRASRTSSPRSTLLDDEVADTDEARRLANLATRRFVSYLELLQPREGESTEEIDISVEVETEDADAAESDAPATRSARSRSSRATRRSADAS